MDRELRPHHREPCGARTKSPDTTNSISTSDSLVSNPSSPIQVANLQSPDREADPPLSKHAADTTSSDNVADPQSSDPRDARIRELIGKLFKEWMLVAKLKEMISDIHRKKESVIKQQIPPTSYPYPEYRDEGLQELYHSLSSFMR